MSKNEIVVDKSDFRAWLKHPITEELFKVLTENANYLKESILDINPIYDDKLERKFTYYSGSLEMCNKVLDITFEDLFSIEEEREEDDEKTPSPW